MYTKEEVLDYIEEEDVKFIRLAYFDVFGQLKNVSILPSRLNKAFEKGVAIDSTAVSGFHNSIHTDLFLKPDPKTMMTLPWRSMDGTVILMICDLCFPDGRPFCLDTRALLQNTVRKARRLGIDPEMSSKFEFYLFRQDEEGNPTRIPFDQGGYMDTAPLDKGENVRRAICLTLEEMGFQPYKSYHQDGPGQNEVDFHFSEALRAADEAVLFKWVVKNTAQLNGLWADFTPRPLDDAPGNGLHIQLRFFDADPDLQEKFMAGILRHIREMTLFFNPVRESYNRFGRDKAPQSVTWSRQNRFVLLRIPALNPDTMDLRSADPTCNPFLAFTLMIEAGLRGVQENLSLPAAWPEEEADELVYEMLPATLEEAAALAAESSFLRDVLPEELLETYLERSRAL